MDKREARARVVRGVALLDEKRPGWWAVGYRSPIDVDTLNLDSTDACVLGQLGRTSGHLHDGYWRLRAALGLSGISENSDGSFHEKDAPYGFNIDWVGLTDMANLARLRDEWVRVITNRRKAARKEAASHARK